MPEDPIRPPDGESDLTRTSARPHQGTSPPQPATSRSSGRFALPGSSSSRHGRFEPGTVLGDRYRLAGMLGRGGMGEVYLADDLALDQLVALKFLPESVETDPARLAQLRNEVRTARQVSHPNVCRVHDLGEADGHYFLTMEYIDGEDLASLLRRVGRLPEERGLELARQVCAGVAAAHARGVLHRDLKPANVMLDANGRVRITDFGLAAATGTNADTAAGTPAYMAPEQLSGRPATEASDIFALGLVLYELFTGKCAFQAPSLAELLRQHEFRAFATPSEIVPGLMPGIEQAILACLEPDPGDRPKSAFAVMVALPGGDPLSAALEAGDTPSPEMVAAAGGDAATLTPIRGVILLAALLLTLIGIAAVADRALLVGKLPADLSADALADRARTIERQVSGGVGATDRVYGFESTRDVVSFWYRTSPRWIVASDPGTRRPTAADPPLAAAGATLVILDLGGRLVDLTRVPPPASEGEVTAGPEVDWGPLFAAAGLSPGSFTEAAPISTPAFFVDTRRAWTGKAADAGTAGLRVEATSLGGHVVSFRVARATARPTARPVQSGGAEDIVSFVATVIVLPLGFVGGIVLARRNLARGRGDRRGASRLGTSVFVLTMIAWGLSAHHVASARTELAAFTAAAAQALLSASVLSLLYVALEPHARRIWPQVLISWSRLTAGRFRDPVIGRDLLVGALAGVVMTLVTFAHYQLPGFFGWPSFRPAASNLALLLGTRAVAGGVVEYLLSALLNALLGAAGLVLTRLVVRRPWPAYAAATAAFSFLAARDQFQTGMLALDLVLGAILVVVVLGAIFRFGLVAGLIAFFVHFVTMRIPVTVDSTRAYFETGLAALAAVFVLGAIGFVLSRAREPLLGRWSGGV